MNVVGYKVERNAGGNRTPGWFYMNVVGYKVKNVVFDPGDFPCFI